MKREITLFLDLDGVLITTKPWNSDDIDEEDGYSLFQPKLVANLNQLLTKWDFKLVLSSSRRKGLSIEAFNQVFQNRGIINKIIDYTSITSEHLSRKQEIELYISEHSVEDFIIIDDDKCLNNLEEKLKNKLVLTQYMLGFNATKLEEAIQKISES